MSHMIFLQNFFKPFILDILCLFIYCVIKNRIADTHIYTHCHFISGSIGDIVSFVHCVICHICDTITVTFKGLGNAI